MLDDIADSLEAKGALKEAAEVDVIANTIEAFEQGGTTLFNKTAKIGKLDDEEEVYEIFKKEYDNLAKQGLNKTMVYESTHNLLTNVYQVPSKDLNRILKEHGFKMDTRQKETMAS